MTLGHLRALLAQYVGLDATTADGLLAVWDRGLLNGAANEISAILKVPRQEMVIPKANLQTGNFIPLPSDAKEVLRVVAPPDYIVPMVTTDDYQDDGTGVAPTVSYEYAYTAIVKSTVPPEVRFTKPSIMGYPERVKVIYFAESAPMVNENDVPWNGKHEPYHRLIALRAAMDALLLFSPGAEGEGEVAIRYKRISERYNELFIAFKNELDKVMYLGRRNLKAPMYARGGGRGGENA